jgi:hypothetical protein
MKRFAFAFVLLLISHALPDPQEDRYLGINLGVGFSKTFLGGYYSWDRNQINVGTDVLAFLFEEGILVAQPTITYNRYLTNNGLYATLGLQTTYAPESSEEYTPPVPPQTQGTYRTIREDDWKTPVLITGIGKSFQYSSWGLHFDASLLSPLNEYVGRVWAVWLGGAVSYRLHLN